MQLGIAHDIYFGASLMFTYNYYKDTAAILYVKKIKCTRKDKIMFNHRFSKAFKKTILQYTVVAIILKIIPTKIDLLTKIHASMVINTKIISYIQLQIITSKLIAIRHCQQQKLKFPQL